MASDNGKEGTGYGKYRFALPFHLIRAHFALEHFGLTAGKWTGEGLPRHHLNALEIVHERHPAKQFRASVNSFHSRHGPSSMGRDACQPRGQTDGTGQFQGLTAIPL